MVETLTFVFNFSYEAANDAVNAVGAVSVESCCDYILDNGLGVDGGGAIAPKDDCPHLQQFLVKIDSAKIPEDVFERPCCYVSGKKDSFKKLKSDASTARPGRPKDDMDGSTGLCKSEENWLCLGCGDRGQVYCSRYVNGHGLRHWEETKEDGNPACGHCVMVSLADLSVWCHTCGAYLVHDDALQSIIKRLQDIKFKDEKDDGDATTGKDDFGYTPLHLAAQNNHVAATALLLQLGCNANGMVDSSGDDAMNEGRPSCCGATPLHRAAFSGATAAMRVLLEWNSRSDLYIDQCDLFAKDASFGDEATPLHKAAAGGRYLAVHMLLEALQQRDTDSFKMAIHMIEDKSLLERALGMQDKNGKTPLEVAEYYLTIQDSERNAVARWDIVAGGVADWEKCVQLLTAAAEKFEKSGALSSDNQVASLPSVPTHLRSGVNACMDCDENGQCVTTSWQASFHKALFGSVNVILGSTQCRPVNNGQEQSRGQPVEANLEKPNDMICRVEENEGPEEESTGLRCSTCSNRTIALYPSPGTCKLICKKCLRELPSFHKASCCWNDILETTRSMMQQQQHQEEDNTTGRNSKSAAIAAFVSPLMEKFRGQLWVYVREMSRCKEDEPALKGQELKKLVLQTRAALRFGMCCSELSMPSKTNGGSDSSSGNVDSFQSIAGMTPPWIVPLIHLLSQVRGDSKCRVSAARLLSNSVTSNSGMASAIAYTIPLSPSPEMVHNALLGTLLSPQKSSENSKNSASARSDANWVDMIVAANRSGNREALAAIVAALHNCLAALSDDNHNHNNNGGRHEDDLDETENAELPNDTLPPTYHVTTETEFASKIASDATLINALVRNFVSAQTVVDSPEIDGGHSVPGDYGVGTVSPDHWDSATEWIQLLLARLATLGLFPLMYCSIGPFDTADAYDDNPRTKGSKSSDRSVVVPEQIVLLHCMQKEATSFVLGHGGRSNTNPFGGGQPEGDSTPETYLFLSMLASKMLVETAGSQRGQSSKPDEDFERALIQSGCITILDLLGCTLGVDSLQTARLRERLGLETALLQESARALGYISDDLTTKMVGKKSRDVHVAKECQQLLTNLVTLIGNMCFKCKQNQDTLRNTLAPSRHNNPMERSGASSKGTETERNGLHVLLSCTAHATSCFTLREWGVVAIRNVLEDNIENQAIVAQLQAASPVQSAKLEDAGIQVNLDSKGKVSLTKINEEDQS
ncbi:MAG: hypothetical protein SGILL_000564 [Bacillariaceae sp.]